MDWIVSATESMEVFWLDEKITLLGLNFILHWDTAWSCLGSKEALLLLAWETYQDLNLLHWVHWFTQLLQNHITPISEQDYMPKYDKIPEFNRKWICKDTQQGAEIQNYNCSKAYHWLPFSSGAQ